MKFDAEQLKKGIFFRVVQEGENSQCRGISTDSRTLKAGELFFALKGPNYDGLRFCDDAIRKGAWGIVVEDPRSLSFSKATRCWIFEVPDTLKALGDLALWWRSRFNIPVVAITGSNGKTTTKEMIAQILATKWRVLKTEGNFNNLIGLPLTLNRLDEGDEIAVLEMGMNDFGEIARLTVIADPKIGVVTNAAAAHLEKLQTVEAVARAKCELFEKMSPEGIAVYNSEDFWLSKFVGKFKGRKISFGMESGNDVHFEHMESRGFDSMELKLSVQNRLLCAKVQTAGIHNVMNAMAACAIALGLEMSLEEMREGLENFKPLKMRFEQIQLANGVRLVNDAYNANPLSMLAAFRTVGRAKRAGRFIAVLGEMKELGEESARHHEAVGKNAAENGVEKLFAIGQFADSLAAGAREGGLSADRIVVAMSGEEICSLLGKDLKAGDIVLVKASRAMRLESVVDALKERFGL